MTMLECPQKETDGRTSQGNNRNPSIFVGGVLTILLIAHVPTSGVATQYVMVSCHQVHTHLMLPQPFFLA